MFAGLIMRMQKKSRETNKQQWITGDAKLMMNVFSSLKAQNRSIKIWLFEHKLSLQFRSFYSLPDYYTYIHTYFERL